MDQPVTRRELEDSKEAIWREISRLGNIIEGPPHPGLETRMERFVTRADTIEVERDKQHKANRWRLDAIIALATAIGAYLVFFHH